MPYRSDAQRKFFHTDTAKKAGITDKEVQEFDQASKGKKLPEHTKKMAEGGEVVPELKDDKSTHDFKEGFHNGIQGDWEALKGAISNAGNKMHETYEKNMGDTGNLKGLQKMADKKSDGYAFGGETNPKHETVKSMENNPTAGFADGGDVMGATGQALGQMLNPMMMPGLASGAANVAQTPGMAGVVNTALGTNVQGPAPTPPPQVDQSFMNALNNGTAMSPTPAPVNPISAAAKTLNSTPPTNPSIYAGIGAPDRAALAQQLLAQKAKPANMVASGVGGLADAITSAFGKQPTNFQGNIRNAQNQNVEQRLGVVDTERQQVLQDIQAKIAVQEADPNSPYSQGMRQFLNAQGMKVPSGMSASMLKQTLPDVTKIFDAKMQALTAQGAQGVEAGKSLMGETLTDWLRQQFEPGAAAGENYLTNRVGGQAAPVANAGGWKVVR